MARKKRPDDITTASQKSRPEPKERELYRKVSVRMWGDEKFRRLSPPAPSGQALWFFLLTGPFTIRIPGLVIGGERAMAEKLRWPLDAEEAVAYPEAFPEGFRKGFREAFEEVSREGLAMADWDAGLVWVPNGIKHNEPESPNVVVGWRSWWQFVPESTLRLKIYQGLRDHLEGMGEAFAEAFDKAYPEGWREGSPHPSPNQEQEQYSGAGAVTAAAERRAGGGIGQIGDVWESRQKTPFTGKPRTEAETWIEQGFPADHLAGALSEALNAVADGRANDVIGTWRTLVHKTPRGGEFRWVAPGTRREEAPVNHARRYVPPPLPGPPSKEGA